jgi:hypothetical protein
VNLHEALDRYAQGTTAHADIEKILRIARRRKASRRLGIPVITAIAIIGLLSATYFLGTRHATLPGVAASSGPSLLSSRLPNQNILPPKAASALPDDHPVGQAEFIYVLNGAAYLVAVDGHQYSVSANDIALSRDSLSPDGRWYVHSGQIRDLQGTTSRVISGLVHLRAWSANSKWLLADANGSSKLIDVTSGRVTDVSTSGGKPIAVLDNGDVVMDTSSATNVVETKRITLSIIAASSGAPVGQLTIDADKVLQAGEGIAGNAGVIRAVVGPNGLALFEVAGAADPTTIGIVASLHDGTIEGRIRAPQGPDQHYFALGFLGEKVMIKEVSVGTPGANETGVRLLLAAPDAPPNEAYGLPAGALVLARAAVFPA